METQDITVLKGYRQDAKGRLVPENMVKDYERLEDETVQKMLGHADELSAQIAKFKGHCFDDVASLMELLSQEYGQKRGGQKGNVTLTSYDGLAKVSLQIQDNINFGAELQVAKSLIDECIASWASDANDNIKMLVSHAFNTDKPNQVNREALFSLRRMNIDDERWKTAMQAINDSIHIVGSKAYMRFHRRNHVEDAWQAVTIDISKA